MLGAIAGDIIGAPYEKKGARIKSKEFPLFSESAFFTDDTVASVALAEVLMNGGSYIDALHRYYENYPRGWGSNFHEWAGSKSRQPYNSWGNGSAMRVSPVGFAFESLEEVLTQAQKSAEITHNHPEGIKGAQATAAAIFMARTGHGKEEIRSYIENTFQYDLSMTADMIRPEYCFDSSCQGTVPQALISFLDSRDFEDAVRTAVSLGGDSDTLACITGGVAEAFYGGVPAHIAEPVMRILDDDLRSVVEEFRRRYKIP